MIWVCIEINEKKLFVAYSWMSSKTTTKPVSQHDKIGDKRKKKDEDIFSNDTDCDAIFYL